MNNNEPPIPTKRNASPIKKVGNFKEYIDIGKSKLIAIYYTYKDVEWDLDGWADSKKYFPMDFDLVQMQLKRGKTVPGWASGLSWCGLRLKKDDEILSWTIRKEDL